MPKNKNKSLMQKAVDKVDHLLHPEHSEEQVEESQALDASGVDEVLADASAEIAEDPEAALQSSSGSSDNSAVKRLRKFDKFKN